MVTGSLFVENLWAALVLAGILALCRFWESGNASEVPIAGLLLGAALAVKLIAAVFLLPAAVLGLAACRRHKTFPAFAAAVVLVVVLGAPPLSLRVGKNREPCIPLRQRNLPIFLLRHLDVIFSDSRYNQPLTWTTPFDLTFQSGKYFEGQAGAVGFQFFLLVAPAMISCAAGRHARKTLGFPLLLATAALSVILILLIALPNLRYLYPALPLLSIPIGAVLVEWPVPGSCAMVGVTLLNLHFLPASGWYHRDFAFFKHSEAQQYLQQAAPIRTLFDHLNRDQPGQPVALFTGDAIAGLNAPSYTNTWHSEAYWKLVREARFPPDIAQLLRERKIAIIVAPVSFESQFPVVHSFLRQWAQPTGVQAGDLAIFHLRDRPVLNQEDMRPLPPGSWDDLDDRIEYLGRWLHDRQFPQSSGHSLTYSGDPGDNFGLKFTGSKIAYIYTKAPNRGTALVSIDGHEAARIDMYSPDIEWQSRTTFDHLASGVHSFEVKILEDKNPRSSGRAV